MLISALGACTWLYAAATVGKFIFLFMNSPTKGTLPTARLRAFLLIFPEKIHQNSKYN